MPDRQAPPAQEPVIGFEPTITAPKSALADASNSWLPPIGAAAIFVMPASLSSG